MLNFNWRKFWHPAIALGIVLVVASLAIRNHGLAAIGLGIAVCGMGEQTLEGYSRFTRPIGFAVIGLGVLLIAFGIYSLLR
jgi:uncharacterized membrane protein